jgi:glycine/D-amino acid oxidase-like deaminating enzyme
MRVAVLGGGFLGCCLGLALTSRGARVTLYDKNDKLLSRAAVANEGRIHLGYTYAADTSLATARKLQQGAFTFASFFKRYLGLDPEQLVVSEPMGYLVHRDSQRSADEVADYFAGVHALSTELTENDPNAYFGRNMLPPRRWSNAEVEAVFDPTVTAAVFDSSEVAVEPLSLAPTVRASIVDNPRTETRLNCTVEAVRIENDRPVVESRRVDGQEDRSAFDQVVNALWDGRLAVDATVGLVSDRQWINRFKYGIRFRPPPELAPLPSVAAISGPFGEILTYRTGLVYASWYPACLRSIAYGVAAPDRPTNPDTPLKAELVAQTMRGLAGLIPQLRGLDPADLSDVLVKGGVVVAPGRTDIPDPHSELHVRTAMGITSIASYHSIYPGKLTLVPYYADICARHLLGN